MNSNVYARRPGAFSPRRPSSPGTGKANSPSVDESDSDSSSSSQVTALSRDTQNPPYPQAAFQRPSFAHFPPSSNASSTSINSFSRPAPPPQTASDRELPSRKNSPLVESEGKSHRRQHSQGFFEPTLPSLPSASSPENAAMAAKLSASQIAAQAAMQHQSGGVQHMRKRSQTVPSPQTPPDHPSGKRKPAPIQTGSEPRRPSGGQPYSNGSVGGGNAAATTAASVAYPRSAPLSPGLTTFDVPPEKEHRLQNQKSKMKLFSKPKQISINNNLESKDRPLPSPNKIAGSGANPLGRLANASVTSFADSIASGASSIYFSNNNASTSTLIPSDRPGTTEKEKKHHFLSRQKNKLKDRMDEHSLPLSSAASNSRPLDPTAPQPLYSFAVPSSPGPSTTSFAKTVSGLDLRHGGRALREKKKEEKAAAMPTLADLKRAEVERLDWAGTGPSGPVFGTSASPGQNIPYGSYGAELPGGSTLQGFGLNNMSAEDAWDFLRAKILIIFEGEELRMPVEDLNKLVLVNIQRCIAKRIPSIIIEDLRDLLQTGFSSLDHSLRLVPDHRLVPRLVDMWLLVFGTILPYVQAVFLPLDLEFKGHGPLMTPREAAEFWGANPDSANGAFGREFDVRRIVLLSYRDHVTLPRHDTLKATFSRLSLESINPSVSLVDESPDLARPSTAASLDPGISSFNSQGSTLIGEGNRSRATSNLSAPELPPFASPPRRAAPQPDSTHVTETVGRMLQCVSVLASLQSRDDAQVKMEGLAKELKLNWLGRGRTGRNRRGFVGTRVRPVMPAAVVVAGSGSERVEQQGRQESHL